MTIRRSKLVALVVCSMAVAGCKESTSPVSALDGHYVLVLVDDKPLPAVFAVTGFTGLQDRVSSSILDFAGPKVTQEIQYDQRTNTGVVTPTVHDSIVGSHATSGDVILLQRMHGATTVVDTAYLTETTLLVRQKLKTAAGFYTTQRFTLKYVREP